MTNTDKLTADTITDDQIIALRDEAAAVPDREMVAVCKSALNPSCHETRRTEARRRCADAINASRAQVSS